MNTYSILLHAHIYLKAHCSFLWNCLTQGPQSFLIYKELLLERKIQALTESGQAKDYIIKITHTHTTHTQRE